MAQRLLNPSTLVWHHCVSRAWLLLNWIGGTLAAATEIGSLFSILNFAPKLP